MGGRKLVSDLAGVPLVRWAVLHALDACRTVIVVLGHDESAVRGLLPQSDSLRVVTNREYRKGMLSTISRGAAQVQTPWFFVAPADMPFIRPSLYRAVAASACPEAEAGPEAVAWVPHYRGSRGHPVLVSARVIGDLTAAAEARAPLPPMRRILQEFQTASVSVDDEGAIIDIDTMGDLERNVSRAEEYQR
jgi:molybdenum cofactor cytidylyltransferase